MIDRDLVRAVARLAHLGLDEEDVPAAAAELASLLEHFESLQAVPTAGVEPLVHAVAEPGVPAADVVAPFPDARAALLGLTEHAREGFLVVPRVLEDGA